MGNDNKFFGQFAGGGSSGGSSVTLKTNATNNASQTILNLTNGTGVTIADAGAGSVTIGQSVDTGLVLSHKASRGGSTFVPITTGGTPYITYEIEIPVLSGFYLFELTSSFFKYLLTDPVNISLWIGDTSNDLTSSVKIADGQNILSANDIGAINRTFWNGSSISLTGLSIVGSKTGVAQPTDYEVGVVGGNNTTSGYAVNFGVTQYLQFAMQVNDFIVPVGAFASLDWCIFNIYSLH